MIVIDDDSHAVHVSDLSLINITNIYTCLFTDYIFGFTRVKINDDTSLLLHHIRTKRRKTPFITLVHDRSAIDD